MDGIPALLKLFATVVVVALCLAPINLPTLSRAFEKTTAERASSPIFDEVADKVGLKFRHYNGMTGKLYLPEIMGSGAALFDFDNDGDLDVFLVQGTVLE
ncbi:MAG: hypothetical protein M3R69_02915, partial [Acidobacteriota bacterium]|nr:hypothetical protein [Acidobacteriota bacterium]